MFTSCIISRNITVSRADLLFSSSELPLLRAPQVTHPATHSAPQPAASAVNKPAVFVSPLVCHPVFSLSSLSAPQSLSPFLCLTACLCPNKLVSLFLIAASPLVISSKAFLLTVCFDASFRNFLCTFSLWSPSSTTFTHQFLSFK